MSVKTKIILFAVLIALFLSGCKDFWHPEGSQKEEEGGNNNGLGNPFTGTSWSGSYYGGSISISFTSNGWTMIEGGYPITGTYIRNGNVAILNMVEPGYGTIIVGQAVISGNNLTLTDTSGQYGGTTITMTGGGNPPPTTGTPSAPTGVTAYASSNSITVSWNSVSGATNYYIYRSSSASGSYSQIGQSYSSTTYTDNGLYAGTYYYKVEAVNSNGMTSPQSSYVSATVTTSSNPTPSATPLTNGVWRNDSITSGDTENWYSFSVTNGTTYRIWWNDSYEGNYTKTADINVSAEYSNGTNIFGGDSAWNTPVLFTASSSGTVYVKVTSYPGTSGGTYAIVYSTSSTRPSGQ